MAASNGPKNDFAPPWLSFPDTNDNARPNGSRNGPILDRPRTRREDAYYTRYRGEYQQPVNRQNSGTDVYDGSKRHSPSHTSKQRHHSMEEDYYYYSNYPYLAYYSPYADPYPAMPFAALPVPPPRRDAKFPPPSSYARYGQVNGSYPYGTFDFYPQGDGFSHYGGGGRGDSVRRSQYARDGRGESRESRDSDPSSHDGDDKDRMFNDDFPSLNGTDDDADTRTSRRASSGGVWDNPPRSRVEEGGGEGKGSTSSIYRVMPAKNGTNVRKDSRGDGGRLNGSVRDASPLASIKSGSGREGQRQSPTPAKEILSSQMARPPKPSDKKSQFLRTLRTEMDNGLTNGLHHPHPHQESNNNLRKGEEEEEEEVVMNGVGDLHLDQHSKASPNILSSSMEKEYSFLVSLGWDPQEKTELITEDEKREFLNRTGKVKEEQQRNGRTRILPKSWSPQHRANNAQPPPPHMNETPSSSDSSDEDL